MLVSRACMHGIYKQAGCSMLQLPRPSIAARAMYFMNAVLAVSPIPAAAGAGWQGLRVLMAQRHFWAAGKRAGH